MEQIGKRILILGSKGMAGHVLYFYLKSLGKYHIADLSRGNEHFVSTYTIADIAEFDVLAQVLQTEKPDIVINCIGILMQGSEDNPDRAILLNSYLPHFLARKGKELNFKMIHITTDCVFSGKKGNYLETDQPEGTGFYARSRALGEVFYGNNLVLRTSMVGPELKNSGIGLFHWFMKQTGAVRGFRNAIWTGVTTVELAYVLEKAIDEDLTGFYHFVNNDKIDKFSLLNLFKDTFNRNDINVEPYDVFVSDKSLVPSTHDFKIRSYKEMLTDMKRWMKNNDHLYSGYKLD